MTTHHNELQQAWSQQGTAYAQAINDMLAFADEHGWDAWKVKEAEDDREALAQQVLAGLREANAQGSTRAFRERFLPSHAPFAALAHEQGQSIWQVTPLDAQRVVFMVGAAYESRQAYLLAHGEVLALAADILAVGKAKRGDVIATATAQEITLRHGWDGPVIRTFAYAVDQDAGITQLLPFNDGSAVLIVSNAGTDLLGAQGVRRLLPTEPEDDDEPVRMDMENGDLSHDNKLICVGSQDQDHLLLDAKGNPLGQIGAQSSYPHCCLFSQDDQFVLSNSCHFYNGISVTVNVSDPASVDVEGYQDMDSSDFQLIDGGMRVYAGASFGQGMILGDAHGYIRAYDWHGKPLWRHFLGGTISGMGLSDDQRTLWVGTYAGVLHQLALGQGQDAHTIGNGNHREDLRLLFWKNESGILKW